MKKYGIALYDTHYPKGGLMDVKYFANDDELELAIIKTLEDEARNKENSLNLDTIQVFDILKKKCLEVDISEFYTHEPWGILIEEAKKEILKEFNKWIDAGMPNTQHYY